MPGIRASISSRQPSPAGMIGVEERLAAGVGLDRPPVRLEQVAQRLAHRAVIVDHEDRRYGLGGGRGPSPAGSAGCRLPTRGGGGSARQRRIRSVSSLAFTGLFRCR